MGDASRGDLPQTVMEISGDMARISTQSSRRDPNAPLQTTYLDYNAGKEIKIALLKGNETIYTVRSFSLNQGLEFQDETAVIAGYTCRKAKTVINTNSMEIWFTTELGIRGSVLPGVAIPDGVVLKVVRNGNVMAEANKVELIKEKILLEPSLEGTELKASAFNYRIQQSQVI